MQTDPYLCSSSIAAPEVEEGVDLDVERFGFGLPVGGVLGQTLSSLLSSEGGADAAAVMHEVRTGVAGARAHGSTPGREAVPAHEGQGPDRLAEAYNRDVQLNADRG